MRLSRVFSALFASGVATAAYASLFERTHYTLRRFEIPVLAPGSMPITVLHLSDIHMTAGQQGKQEWLRALADLQPDLVVNTGDNLAGHDAIEPTADALRPLFGRPGVFVMGSNDYYAPRWKNPLKYFVKNHKRVAGIKLPWEGLRDAMTDGGWLDLDNARGTLEVAGRRIAFAGLDDPHIKRERYAKIEGPADASADLRIGVVHAPEPRILDRFADDGYDLLLCGHTHGGQLRIPFYGPLVTNCGIDKDRARWVSEWRPGKTWLHVSAGLGTSPYAPYRFACPPEATLLTLTARPA